MNEFQFGKINSFLRKTQKYTANPIFSGETFVWSININSLKLHITIIMDHLVYYYNGNHSKVHSGAIRGLREEEIC